MSNNPQSPAVVRPLWQRIPLAVLAFLWAIVRWTLWIVGLPFYPFHAKVSKDKNQVWCTSMPKLIFAWPLVPGGLLAWWLGSAGIVSSGFLGWAFLLGLALLVILLADDLNIISFIVIGIVVGLFLALAQLANLQYQIPVLADIGHFFKSLDVQLAPGFALGAAVVFGLLLLVYGLPRAYLNGRHEMTTRGIEHVKFGVRTDLTPCAGRTISVLWPDVLEFLIGFGAGTVVMKDRGGHVIKQVENVFGLYFVHRAIENVFEASGVRAQVDEDDNVSTTGDM